MLICDAVFEQVCLNVVGKVDQFSSFDELYDLPEQSLLRDDCCNLVGKLISAL